LLASPTRCVALNPSSKYFVLQARTPRLRDRTGASVMQEQRGPISESAGGLTDRLRSDGRQQLETRKRMAAEQIEEVAHALSRAGEQLESQPTLAGYASQIATNVSNLATRLRDGSIEDLVDDTRQLARRNPGLFILGSFAAGVALARFLKSTQQTLAETREEDYGSEFADASAAQEDYPSRDYSPSVGTTEQPYPPTSGG
jgi:hypothetical protein